MIHFNIILLSTPKPFTFLFPSGTYFMTYPSHFPPIKNYIKQTNVLFTRRLKQRVSLAFIHPPFFIAVLSTTYHV